jgi:hypothetical protein
MNLYAKLKGQQTAEPPEPDVEWLLRPDNVSNVASRKTTISPAPLTKVEVYDSSEFGLQALFCSSSSVQWSSHMVLGPYTVRIAYRVFESAKGFQTASVCTKKVSHMQAFHLASSPTQLVLSKAGKLSDKRLYGFVFGFDSGGHVVELGCVFRAAEPAWLGLVMLANLCVLVGLLVCIGVLCHQIAVSRATVRSPDGVEGSDFRLIAEVPGV